MMEIDRIHRKLQEKEEKLTKNQRLITPDSGMSAQQQAVWMIQLLQHMYTEHGIAKIPEKVIESITTNQCRCWFILEDDQPVAMAALVTQADGSVELGRAVSIRPGEGLGSIVMLHAGLLQLEANQTSLVAEVRVADTFEGVPSGEATQRILFGQFQLKPHAVAPMFHHGDPVRQEMFALATSQSRQPTERIVVPSDKRALKKLQGAIDLSNNLFEREIAQTDEQRMNGGFELVQTEPFSILVPSANGSTLETSSIAGFEKSNFVLLPVELCEENTHILLTCLNAGWVPCGVDRNVGGKSHPVLLFGKLKEGTLLAPTNIVDSNIDSVSVRALRRVDKEFRT